jgi:hypothetical protein
MSETLELGRRVELVPMDGHFHAISIALYQSDGAGGPSYRVHSYSKRHGTPERLAAVVRTMAELSGMERVAAEPFTLRFPCGSAHLLACRRAFLEACKLASDAAPGTRPLTIHDKKSSRSIRVESIGQGRYQLSADGAEADKASRLAAIANGLVKLGEMGNGGDAGVVFACGLAHDALVGLLLGRALNVRAALREEEMAAARGVLAAPSAQAQQP